MICTALALSLCSAGATSTLVFDASEQQPTGPQVSAPEIAALKRLYGARGAKVCGDFRVRDRQGGQFTALRKQTLYLVENCYADFAANMMRTRWRTDLLILDGTRLNYFKTAFADDVTVLPSVNGTGLNALVTQMWYGPHMGEFGSTGQLQAFVRGRFRPLLTLGTVYRDLETTQNSTAMRRTLWFDPGRPNTVRVVEYTSPATASASGDPYDRARAKQTFSVTVNLLAPPTRAAWQQN